ncbi:hypothetical protein A0H81_01330 [Grifola frondosa]|uniref:Reverse transcriptase domain-containing protein n=1 Tax=Grifola frondosa TaxID=5627 RepID=A0A1C7MR77_GRIFR|nr:hypothetical protein A0H81_01330 [Grifola frondosa]
MARIGHPDGVGGNDLDVFGLDGPGSRRQTAEPEPRNCLDRIRENTRREARNKVRAEKRALGEEVDEDEELLRVLVEDDQINDEIDELRRDINTAGTGDEAGMRNEENDMGAPPPPFLASGGDLLSEVLKLTPKTRKTVFKALELATGDLRQSDLNKADSSLSEPVFTHTAERQANLFDRRRIQPHPQLAAVLANKNHLPLTLCTSAAITEMNRNPSKLVYEKIHDANAVKRSILKVSEWPLEAEMNAEDWRDAWPNFLVILERIASSVIVERFRAHFNWLCGVQDFKANYLAILQFDIELRRSYFTAETPVAFTVASDTYRESYRDCRIEELSQRQPQSELRSNSNTSYGSNRYQPYRNDNRRLVNTQEQTAAEDIHPPNHKSGIENLDFIKSYINEQVTLGRMTGPYTRTEVEKILGTPFVSSPLAVVEKPGSAGKWRLVQNCSYEDENGISVNSQINSDDFPTKWGTAAQVAEIVATAPLGTQAASLDIDSAFRNLPVFPAHKAFLVIQCEEGVFYIDHVVPFGITSGVGIQGEPMDAVVDVLEAHEIGPNRKWVDDLFNFRFPTAPLGVPWHQTKCKDYAFEAVYVGFLWDLWNRTVSLPEVKRLKYVAKLTAFVEKARDGRVSQKDTMSINGTLSHITFIYPRGRSYLTNLCAFIASFRNKHAPRYPPRSMISDLTWWLQTLGVSGVRRSLTPRGPLKDIGIWVDASTDWGIGIIVDGRWAAWKWRLPTAQWKTHGRDIGWAEMIAVELAARFVEQLGYKDSDILVRGDNSGVVGAVTRGRSRNFQANESIRRTEVLSMSLNIYFRLEYVNTKVNKADPVSRGKPDPSMARLPVLFTLPPELELFLLDA